MDAFSAATDAKLRLPETDDPAADFGVQITELGALLAGDRGTVHAAMLGGARTDADLARALGERWLAPRRAWREARIAAAIAAGRCRPGMDLSTALGLLYGPLYAPLLFGQPVPPSAAIKAHLRVALPAVFVA